jgi:hypothetical protein
MTFIMKIIDLITIIINLIIMIMIILLWMDYAFRQLGHVVCCSRPFLAWAVFGRLPGISSSLPAKPAHSRSPRASSSYCIPYLLRIFCACWIHLLYTY